MLTRLRRYLGISEDDKVTLGNEKIYQVDSFTYLGSAISKDTICSGDFKSRIIKAKGVFSVKKLGRIGRYVCKPRLEY